MVKQRPDSSPEDEKTNTQESPLILYITGTLSLNLSLGPELLIKGEEKKSVPQKLGLQSSHRVCAIICNYCL